MFGKQEQQRARPHIRRIGRVEDEQLEVEMLERQLRRWKGVWGVCKAAGREAEHEVGQCVAEQGRLAEEDRRGEQRMTKYDRYSGCFGCGLPQRICRGWKSNDSRGWRRTGQGCQFKGVLFGALYRIKYGYEKV